jgi:hypothetical protein
MKTWSGSYTAHAGDTIILRGCDVWTNSNFPITWSYSGSSGNPITINGNGDPTWYNTTNCPSGWNRPVFDLQSSQTSSGFVLDFNGSSAQYTTVKWIEIKNFYWNGSEQCCGIIHTTANNDYLTLSYSYIHAWTHGSSASELDYMFALVDYAGSGNAECVHCVFDHDVFNNLDGDGANCHNNSGCTGGSWLFWSLTNSVCAYMNNCFHGPTVHGPLNLYGNNIFGLAMDGIPNAQHPNALETTGDLSGGDGSSTTIAYIHDNYIHDTYTAEGLQVGNGPGEIDYVWNNIWDMGSTVTAGENGPQLPQNSSSSQMAGSSVYFFNNTVRWAGEYCVTLTSALARGTDLDWTLHLENNICITSSGPITSETNGDPLPSGAVVTPNTGITVANASTYYPTGGAYIFAPESGCTAANCTGFGAATNLTNTTPGCGTPGLAGLCSDTTYAVTQQTVNGVVEAVDGGRTPVARPTTGAWDAGAYQQQAGSAPAAPTGLAAVVM